MAIKVIKAEFTDRTGTVIIEAEDMEEVTSSEARQIVLAEAGKNGLQRAGLGGNESPYPVDKDGNTSQDMLFGKGAAVAGYRADYQVTAAL